MYHLNASCHYYQNHLHTALKACSEKRIQPTTTLHQPLCHLMTSSVYSAPSSDEAGPSNRYFRVGKTTLGSSVTREGLTPLGAAKTVGELGFSLGIRSSLAMTYGVHNTKTSTRLAPSRSISLMLQLHSRGEASTSRPPTTPGISSHQTQYCH